MFPILLELNGIEKTFPQKSYLPALIRVPFSHIRPYLSFALFKSHYSPCVSVASSGGGKNIVLGAIARTVAWSVYNLPFLRLLKEINIFLSVRYSTLEVTKSSANKLNIIYCQHRTSDTHKFWSIFLTHAVSSSSCLSYISRKVTFVNEKEVNYKGSFVATPIAGSIWGQIL